MGIVKIQIISSCLFLLASWGNKVFFCWAYKSFSITIKILYLRLLFPILKLRSPIRRILLKKYYRKVILEPSIESVDDLHFFSRIRDCWWHHERNRSRQLYMFDLHWRGYFSPLDLDGWSIINIIMHLIIVKRKLPPWS